MTRYAAAFLSYKQSVAPDQTSDIVPGPGDLWIDQSQTPPVVKKCTAQYPFTWASIEGSGSSTTFQVNGVVLSSSAIVNFQSGSNTTVTNPSAGNVQINAAGAGAVVFADAEVPSGLINGSNVTFTLANAPNPAASLNLHQNGITLTPTNDYTLASATITMVVAPATGDTLIAWYRH